jgi:hypothetical protein
VNSIPKLKTIERKAYLSAHQDGLIDIGLGLVFLLFGIIQWTGRTAFSGVSWMPALFIGPAKRMITVPRIGLVKFGPSRKVLAVKIGLLVLCAAVILFIVAATTLHSTTLDGWTRRYFATSFGLALALFPLAGAIGLGVRRYYGYAFLLIAAFTALRFWHGGLGALFVLIGTAVTGTGFSVLARFLKDHPIKGKEKQR